jgi:RimJ/RimL family protein N-acetyltransferase
VTAYYQPYKEKNMSNHRQTFLSGDRINLVLLTEEDNPTMLPWINNPEVSKYLSYGATPMTPEVEATFIENAYKSNEQIVFGIWHKKDQKLIGNTGFHQIDQLHQTASFGIIIGDAKYWSEGHGTEVLNLMINYAFNRRNLRNITLSVIGNNPRGKRCYEKCGFQEVGRFTKHLFKDGKWHDEILMRLINPLYL